MATSKKKRFERKDSQPEGVSRVLPPVRLSAYGLGLMIGSPVAVTALEEGGDYMPARGPLREPLRSLVETEQRVVLLGTGSPQLDYVLVPRLGPASMSARRSAAAQVEFGLHVEGGTVCVRDGYDPMKWTRRVSRRQTIALADGYYVVHALWIDSEADEDMRILLCFTRRSQRLPGDGWPYLGYRV
jgi:hypothetical protein